MFFSKPPIPWRLVIPTFGAEGGGRSPAPARLGCRMHRLHPALSSPELPMPGIAFVLPAKVGTATATLLPWKLITIIKRRLPNHLLLKSSRHWAIWEWLNRLSAYLNLSALEKLPTEARRALLYNSFATTQVRQDKTVLNNLSPPWSTAPGYGTFIKILLFLRWNASLEKLAALRVQIKQDVL